MKEQTELQLREDDHWLGNAHARCVIVQYGAYQSAASRACWAVLRQAFERQPQHLCAIYRHFPPLGAEGYAAEVAEAAECAAEQGRFWDMHELLCAHGDAPDDGSLVEYAVRLQLDVPKFLRGLSARRFKERVARDLASGLLLGIAEAPALWCGKRRLNAAEMDNLAGMLGIFLQEAAA